MQNYQRISKSVRNQSKKFYQEIKSEAHIKEEGSQKQGAKDSKETGKKTSEKGV